MRATNTNETKMPNPQTLQYVCVTASTSLLHPPAQQRVPKAERDVAAVHDKVLPRKVRRHIVVVGSWVLLNLPQHADHVVLVPPHERQSPLEVLAPFLNG